MTKIDNDYLKVKSATRKSSFIKKNELKLTGKDLLDLGVEQAKVGMVLENIYNSIIKGKLKNNREKLIDFIINQVLPSGYDEDLFK